MNGFWGTYWNIQQLVRWSLTSVILVVLSDFIVFQIMSLMMMSILVQCLLLNSRPFKDKSDNQIAIFNEVMVSIYLYILVVLNISTGSRELIGMVLLSVIIVSFLGNLFNFICRVSKELIMRIKKNRRNKEDQVVKI